jgi:hypothetical protein
MLPQPVNISDVPFSSPLVHRLQAENHEFRQQAGYWKSRHCDNLKCINALERKAEPIPMVFRALLAV